jgi:deazaflavin-dependent oxidoreductase (nitroreductase family)
MGLSRSAGIKLSLSWLSVDPPHPPPRTRKYRILKIMLWGGNHVMRWQLQHGLAPRAFALVETVGRRTGQPRQTCVGNGLMGDAFWVVAAHGQQADWVRNISEEPRVRVLANGRWRRGTATLMPEDDPGQRSRTLPFQWDAAIGRAIATRPLTVRIDLERQADSGSSPVSGPRAE